jgi:hypothetical protein
MPQHRKQITMNDAAGFLVRSFTSGEEVFIYLPRLSDRDHTAHRWREGSSWPLLLEMQFASLLSSS